MSDEPDGNGTDSDLPPSQEVDQFTKKQRAHFNFLTNAGLNGALGLVMCRDLKTGEKVPVVAAVGKDEVTGNVQVMPLARLFSDDGANEVAPMDLEHGKDFTIMGRKLDG